jgi:hypothetical protein
MTKRVIDIREGRPWLDIATYARRGPTAIGRLTPAQREQVARTVGRVPEVMVKVSGGGRSADGVAAHLKYIDRRGQLPIETDDGERLQGRGVEKRLLKDWGLDLDAAESHTAYSGVPGRRPAKLVHNVVLSMPAGTPPAKLLAAARDFAREQFALKQRYATVLHTDQGHPHVHLVIRAVSEQGVRLNIRKATLREWRHEFARHLREHGVAANATDRLIRGATKSRKTDSIHRAMLRGDSSHFRDRIAIVAGDLRRGALTVEPGKAKLIETRSAIEQAWQAIGSILARDGHQGLANQVKGFLAGLPPVRTEREEVAAALLARIQARENAPPTQTR